jgi:type II secretion system protein C
MKLLIATLLSSVIMFEGWAFLSKPKVNLDKSSLYEEELSGIFTAVLEDKFKDLHVEAESVEDNKIEKEDLELELLGTAIGSIKDPIAFIKDLTCNKQGIYRLGSVIREAKVVKIVMGEVTLNINGKEETLRLSKRGIAWAKLNEGTPAIVSVSAGQIVLSKRGLLNEADNILNTLRNIKVRPYHQAKEVVGMLVEGVPENSIITNAGIHNKDIIKTVNNQKIDSYQKALQVFSKARNQSEIKVSLLREGQVKNLSYSIGQ